VVGFKPTRGTVSRWGLVAYASSLDTPGVLAGTVDDAARVLRAVAGPDGRDETCLPDLVDFSTDALPARDVVVGVPVELASVRELHEGVRAAWRDAARRLRESGGFRVRAVSLPSLVRALPAYYVTALTEASSNLARYDGVRYGHRSRPALGDDLATEYSRTRSEAFGEEVQRRLLMGALALSARDAGRTYEKAVRVRAALAHELDSVLSAPDGCDVLLTPTAPTPAPELGAERDPVAGYLQDAMTVAASLAGLPAVSVPVGLTPVRGTASAPVAVQIVGPSRADALVLSVARRLEAVVAFERPRFLAP